jgi:hypothetical protein
MMSTSQCVAEIDRRITTRSITNAITADAMTATVAAAHSGRPSPWYAVQPTNAEIMSMSPCAKFSVRVAL